MVQFTDYVVRSKFGEDNLKISELTRCIPKACFERKNKSTRRAGFSN